MKSTFDLSIKELRTAYDLPEMWQDADFRLILEKVEFSEIDDIAPEDLHEMAIMALQDIKPAEAVEAILACLAGALSVGARKNLVHEFKDGRLWEDYADSRFHQPFFLTAVLLNQAFPKLYDRPDIVRLKVQIAAAAGGDLPQSPTLPFIVRLLAAGMEDHSTLVRLFGSQLKGGSFPEAAAIIWKCEVTDSQPGLADWTVWGPRTWLRPLQSVGDFAATVEIETQK